MFSVIRLTVLQHLSFQHLSTLINLVCQRTRVLSFCLDVYSPYCGVVRLPLGLSQLRHGESSAPTASQNVLAKVWQHSAKPRFVETVEL